MIEGHGTQPGSAAADARGGKPNPDAPLSIRYTISVSDAGEWIEIGELATDGETYHTFFEMTLQRANG